MIKVLELFGGIGAFSKALERCGIDYEIADYVEIDKYAVKSFNAMHNTNFEPQDIKEWDKDIKVDIIMHGSPCQDFSKCGLQKGGDENSGTRSSLMYETLRIVEKIKPRIVIWENVKNLLSKAHKHNFEKYLERMEKLGYKNYYKVINSKGYVPQNRERVFVVSIKGEHNAFEFPDKQESDKCIKDILENEVDEKYYIEDKYENIEKINENYSILTGGKADKWFKENKRVYDTKSIAPTLTTCGGGNRQVKIIVHEDALRVRKLTSKEYWRLQGFDDSDYEKAAAVNSPTQLYKQAGNSIVVDVLCAIIESLKNAFDKNNMESNEMIDNKEMNNENVQESNTICEKTENQSEVTIELKDKRQLIYTVNEVDVENDFLKLKIKNGQKAEMINISLSIIAIWTLTDLKKERGKK